MGNYKIEYTEQFRKQIVDLYKTGVCKSDIVKEYGISYATINRWIATDSNLENSEIKEKGMKVSEQQGLEKELKKMREHNQQLKEEVETLKKTVNVLTRN